MTSHVVSLASKAQGSRGSKHVGDCGCAQENLHTDAKFQPCVVSVGAQAFVLLKDVNIQFILYKFWWWVRFAPQRWTSGLVFLALNSTPQHSSQVASPQNLTLHVTHPELHCRFTDYLEQSAIPTRVRRGWCLFGHVPYTA